MRVLKQNWPEPLGVYYWCVNKLQCGYMEHGLKHITFYVQKLTGPLAVCNDLTLVRDKALAAPGFVRLVQWIWSHLTRRKESVLCWFMVRNRKLFLCRVGYHKARNKRFWALLLAVTKQLLEHFCLSVRVPVCLLHIFHYVLILVSSCNSHSYYQWQKWCPCKRSMSDVKGQGHRGPDPT